MPRLLSALLVTLLFAVIGRVVGGVNLSGAAAGWIVAFALYYCIGPSAFAALVAVFAVTWTATRLGYARKQRLGVAESRRGRTAGQVLANLGVSGVLAVLGMFVAPELAWLGSMAALCEAAADTACSECGEAWSDSAYLITGLRRVPAGTDGAITVVGTLAGVAAAALVATVAAWLGVLTWPIAAIAGVAGFLGAIVDSLLGATLERRGLMNNNAVNFSSTCAAALAAIALNISLSGVRP